MKQIYSNDFFGFRPLSSKLDPLQHALQAENNSPSKTLQLLSQTFFAKSHNKKVKGWVGFFSKIFLSPRADQNVFSVRQSKLRLVDPLTRLWVERSGRLKRQNFTKISITF